MEWSGEDIWKGTRSIECAVVLQTDGPFTLRRSHDRNVAFPVTTGIIKMTLLDNLIPHNPMRIMVATLVVILALLIWDHRQQRRADLPVGNAPQSTEEEVMRKRIEFCLEFLADYGHAYRRACITGYTAQPLQEAVHKEHADQQHNYEDKFPDGD